MMESAAQPSADDATASDWRIVAEALYPFEGASGFVRFRRIAAEEAKLVKIGEKNVKVKRVVGIYG